MIFTEFPQSFFHETICRLANVRLLLLWIGRSTYFLLGLSFVTLLYVWRNPNIKEECIGQLWWPSIGHCCSVCNATKTITLILNAHSKGNLASSASQSSTY